VFHSVLVGLDGSDASRRALQHAVQLAALTGAKVHALSVAEQIPAYAATMGEVEDEQRFAQEYFDRVQDDARTLADRAGVSLSVGITAGHAAQALLDEARRRSCDLIVVGRSGHSRLHHLLLGGTADRVVDRAGCAVTVVP
jgi:nucleotide-binding universal stress UspA family protein